MLRARSRLYRSRRLQVNVRFAAFSTSTRFAHLCTANWGILSRSKGDLEILTTSWKKSASSRFFQSAEKLRFQSSRTPHSAPALTSRCKLWLQSWHGPLADHFKLLYRVSGSLPLVIRRSERLPEIMVHTAHTQSR